MLRALSVKNIALIKELFVEFESGFNVITGETGSGKSILLDSIALLTGAKPKPDFLREGESEVAGLFFTDENELLIERKLAGAKSVFKINGRLAVGASVREIPLMDIQGQRERQLLLEQNKHIDFLDNFCRPDFAALEKLLAEYKKLGARLSELAVDERERLSKLDLREYQINEIESERLGPNDEAELLAKKTRLASVAKLKQNAGEALYFLRGENGALDKLAEAEDRVSRVLSVDKDSGLESLALIAEETNDAARALESYLETLSEADESELVYIEEKINRLALLKRKYGSDIPKILEYLNKIKSEREILLNAEDEIQKLLAEKSSVKKNLLAECEKISGLRKTSALNLEANIIQALAELEMPNVKFKILIESEKSITPRGFDRIEFLISPNVGEELKPLAKTASGGETSRVLLAVKTIVADLGEVGTYIFDEIDSGVSGATAAAVARKLKELSAKRQILCVTHSPQIAAAADAHFLVEKFQREGATFTQIKKLSPQERPAEIARLIGKISPKSLKAAEELIINAYKSI
jgi:DNA repair protein RecN (Recombination protein N)